MWECVGRCSLSVSDALTLLMWQLSLHEAICRGGQTLAGGPLQRKKKKWAFFCPLRWARWMKKSFFKHKLFLLAKTRWIFLRKERWKFKISVLHHLGSCSSEKLFLLVMSSGRCAFSQFITCSPKILPEPPRPLCLGEIDLWAVHLFYKHGEGETLSWRKVNQSVQGCWVVILTLTKLFHVLFPAESRSQAFLGIVKGLDGGTGDIVGNAEWQGAPLGGNLPKMWGVLGMSSASTEVRTFLWGIQGLWSRQGWCGGMDFI